MAGGNCLRRECTRSFIDRASTCVLMANSTVIQGLCNNNETVDAMSLEKIDRIIDVMRQEAWRCIPVSKDV